MADIQKYSEQTFESIKHYTEDGEEFWFAVSFKKFWSTQSGVISQQ